MKRGLLVVLVLLFSLSVVYAVDVTYEVVQGDVLPGDNPKYNLKILNNEDYDIFAQLSSLDLWVLEQENQRFTVSSGSSRVIEVSFKPKIGIKPGSYGINIIVKTQNVDVSSQTSRFEKVLPVRLVAYDQAVDAKFVPTAIIQPRRPALLKLNIINKYQIDYEDLQLKIESEHFQATQTFNLARSETKIIEIPASVDADVEEGTYNSHVKLMYKDKIFVDKTISYLVSAYEDVKELVEPESRFLYSGEQVTRTNEGNTPVQQTYKKKFDFLAYKLAKFNPEPTSVKQESGGYVAEWEFTLGAGEAKTVGYYVNYRFPTLIVVLIIIAFALVHVFRKKNAIVVTKRILAMQGESGSLHVMKVLISVKNRGNVTVKDIKVLDKVPSTIRAPTKYGMHKPSKVQAIPEGTAMVWDIPVIPAGQERLLSYAIEGKVQVLDRIVLSGARAKYILFGKQIVARSPNASLRSKK